MNNKSIIVENSNIDINYNNLPTGLEELIIKNDKLQNKEIDLGNLPYTLKKLVISNQKIKNINLLPFGIEEIYLYEVYTNTNNYFDIPPSVNNCKITSVARNFVIDNILKSGYYCGNNIDFTKQYIDNEKIISF